MKNFSFILILLLTLTACSLNKEYTYVEVVNKTDLLGDESLEEEDPETISAPSDSAAYLEAYRKFCISQKVYKDMQEERLKPSGKPISFKLYNDLGDDISTSTIFVSMNEKEEEIRNEIAGLENSFSGLQKNDNKNQNISRVDSTKINELLPFFNMKSDEFDPDGTTWITPKSAPKYTNMNGIYLYFGKEKNIPKKLRFKLQYYADDWLFITKVQFSIDGKAFEYIPFNTETDHGDGMIWEWFDEELSSKDKELIEALANAKSAKMKLIGTQYHNIKEISKNQITDINRSLELYRAMGGSF